MLFTKAISKISYEDVISFCTEKIQEGFITEYKSNFPENDKLAKILSAFANTYGGILIIGINAPHPESVPVEPFEGIDYEGSENFEQRIEQVCIQRIFQPIFPEVAVCKSEDGLKAFVIIRVQESDATPHLVHEKKEIYIRTGESSNPIELAEWEKIEWLGERRKESINLRKRLLEEAEKYFDELLEINAVDINDKQEYFGYFSINSIPLFPSNPICSVNLFSDIEQKIKYNDFPDIGNRPTPVKDGVHFIRHHDNGFKHGGPFAYYYLNRYGVYLYKEHIGFKHEEKSGGVRRAISFTTLGSILVYYLFSARNFFEYIGYFGSIQLNIELKNALGVNMGHPLNGTHTIGRNEENLIISRNYLIWEKNITYGKLNDQLDELASELLVEIGWSMGVRFLTKEYFLKDPRLKKFKDG